MTNYKALVVATKYWRPGEDWLEETVRHIEGIIVDGDFLIVSEKAISTASNNIIDECKIKPHLNAKLIAIVWMRVVWGRLLGFLCHFRERLLEQLRNYPIEMGARHKQVALQYAGLLQALMFGSEGGIDGSNLPYSYVSLPLDHAGETAERIRCRIRLVLGKKVSVMIVDTDKTYSLGNFHFTPRPKPMEGIHSHGGALAYVVGRVLRLRKRATPIAVAGCRISVEEALEMAQAANRARGFGAGRTVWDMAARFKVGLTDVSWEMLDTVKHKPIVILRSKR